MTEQSPAIGKTADADMDRSGADVHGSSLTDLPENTDWHSHPVDEVFDALNSSERGLTEAEAQDRLGRFGPNRLQERRRAGPWMRFLAQFHSPLIYVLLATAGVTGILQHWIDTGVILAVVIINAVIGFLQESKAEEAIASLKQMLAPQTLALREGAKTDVPVAELVPGDVVLLQPGDKVPADLRLFRVKNLQVDEAPLTGESVPVDKTTDVLQSEVALGDRSNMAFAGTLVTTGEATGVVVGTGDRTELGRIAGMLQDVEGVDTPLIRRMARFSKVITVVIVVSCVVVFGLGILAGQDVFQMLMVAVAIAVSAIPEGLPAIITIGLAIGVKRMARRNAVVRKLPAVEALGSTTVICTDKTGTLTRNEMTVTQVVTVDDRFRVEGTGYSPTGAILDEDGSEISRDDAASLKEMVNAGVLCNDADLRRDGGEWIINGDPTEASLLVLAAKLDVNRKETVQSWPRTDVIPFQSENQFMATLHHNHERHAVIYLKGSPEAVLARCAVEWGHEEPLDTDGWKKVAAEMAAEGLRVLAIAEKQHDPHDTVLDMEETADGFALWGLVGIMDPPRQEVIDAVAKCHEAGIRVKLITGDHAATAKAIARQVGISREGDDSARTGPELEKLSEADFDRAVAEVDVFARVSPAQKLKFVQSLQRQGQIVAMTGDGVNDAPALKQADIGVAMGITGTDVSKEAAEMVLLDDNFASIERAVEEGRTVFNNLKKTILFILPTNGGECVTLLAALLLGTTLPILPLHILWINLITTVALAITLAFDPVPPDIMRRPPRDPRSPLIDPSLVWRIVYVSVLMAAGTFGLFIYERKSGHSVELAQSVAVNAIVFFEVAYLFNSRHLTGSILNRRGFLGNRVVWAGVAAVVLFQLLFTYWPLLNNVFRVAPLDAPMWARVLAAAVLLLLLVEGEKALSRRWTAAETGSPQSRNRHSSGDH